MIGANRECSFDGWFVAIAPLELAGLPIEVRAVPVAQQKFPPHREVERHSRKHAIVAGRIRSSYVSVSSLEHKGSLLGVIQIESGDSLKLEKRFEVQLQAGSV